jgi:hypothetical protein
MLISFISKEFCRLKEYEEKEKQFFISEDVVQDFVGKEVKDLCGVQLYRKCSCESKNN